ncbi:MAG: dihydropteroate synthase, partial [Actinomycetota bacterium]|nr:dihydropteroate synthase [Actinomycetota bacterium]
MIVHPAIPDPGRCVVIGIINVTPDSFSDGGRYLNRDDAVAHGLTLRAQGADLIDVGGESTRPGATPVDAPTERARVVPVIERLARSIDVPISVDTTKA